MKRNEVLFTVYRVFLALTFFGPYWQKFCRDTIGMLQFQIFSIECLFVPVLIVMEIGSGVIADRFSRKFILIVGPLFNVLSMIIFAFAKNVWTYVLTDFLWFVGMSLVSGTDEALLYDSTNEGGKRYRKILDVSFSITMICFAASHAIAGLMIKSGFDMNMTMLATAGTSFFACLVAMLFKEPVRKKMVSSKEIFTNGSRQVLKNKKIILVGAFFGFLLLQRSHLLYLPYFEQSGLPLWMFGIAFGVFNLFGSLVGVKSRKIESKLGGLKKALPIMLFARLATWGLMLTLAPTFGWLFILGEQFARAMHKQMFSELINKSISSEVRATALSITPQMIRFVGIPVYIFVGWSLDNLSFEISLATLMAVSAIGGVITLIFLRKEVLED